MIEPISWLIPVGILVFTILLIVIGFFVPPIGLFLLANSLWILGINLIAWAIFIAGNLVIGYTNQLLESPLTLAIIIIFIYLLM